MNFLINQKTHARNSVSAHRFISYHASIKNPSNFGPRIEQHITPFHPIQFFNDPSNSKYCTLKSTKLLHATLLKTPVFQSDMFLTNSLLRLYSQVSSAVYALKLFDTITQPNVVSWNTMISGLNINNFFEDSWWFFCKMHDYGFEPNEVTYGSVLSACSALQSPCLGKLVYSFTVKNGFFSNGYVRAGMIDLLAKNYDFKDALRVFWDVSCENVVCWNSIISGAVKNEENHIALGLFRDMCSRFLVPNGFTFSSLLSACATTKELQIGKGVQGWVIKCAAQDVFVSTALVDLYSKCGVMDDALKVFSRIPNRNVVSWTAIISGFVNEDDSVSALNIFKDMRNMSVETNIYTITSIISACANPSMIHEAIQVHSWILKTGFYMDSVVSAALINMYSKIGAIDLSEMVFKDVKHIPCARIFTVMISSFAQNHSFEKTIELFQKIIRDGSKPDTFCTSSLLSIIESTDLGSQIHCYILKAGLVNDLSVSSSLFTMYSKCGSFEDSFKVFDQIPVKDNVSRASMIAGFGEHGYADQAFQLFSELLAEETKPDEKTLIAVLTACSASRLLQKGKEIHGHALRVGTCKETLVGSAILNMYSQCSALESARNVFDMLPHKDHVSYSSLISGYAQNNLLEQAMFLFKEKLMSDLSIDSSTVSTIIGAAAVSDNSVTGAQFHSLVTKTGLNTDASVGSSLLTMYSKCGSIEDCYKAFNQIRKPDLIAWSAMIASYAQHGQGTEALRIFDLMKREKIKPDEITFVGVLSACSHNGLVEEGYFHLNSMQKDYGIQPCPRHYACMVDLLGRSGRLKEAEKFIYNMPIEPDALVWGTLLASCKVHGAVELGKLAAKKVVELNPHGAGVYVSLSNILADVGQWEEVQETRNLMKGTGVTKEPGWSFV